MNSNTMPAMHREAGSVRPPANYALLPLAIFLVAALWLSLPRAIHWSQELILALTLLAMLVILHAHQLGSRRLMLIGSTLFYSSFLLGYACDVSGISAVTAEVSTSGSARKITLWRGAAAAAELRTAEWNEGELRDLLRSALKLNRDAAISTAASMFLAASR